MALGTTSGQYLFAPPVSDIFLESFSRIGVRGTAITRRHMIEAKRSINLELQGWSNGPGPNLWEINLSTIALVAGQATYTLPATTVSVLDVYYTTVNGGGAGVNIDRIMLPISRTQYAMIPNKLQPGTPTVYWFERLNPPTLTFWEPPDVGAPTQVISYYWLKQIQDAAPTNGQIADVPYRFEDALCAGLAVRLAEKFAPERLKEKMEMFTAAWNKALSTDQENAPVSIQPTIFGYWP